MPDFGPAFFASTISLSYVRYGEAFGTTCACCKRAIAAPVALQGRVIWCLYCGMERGKVPLAEREWDSSAYPYGLTAQEAADA